MNKRFSIAITALLIAIIGSQARAQEPISKSEDPARSALSSRTINSSIQVAQLWRIKHTTLSLMPENINGTERFTSFSMTPAAGPNLAVVGGGTLGRLPKWTGFTGANSIIGDSTIFEDKFGKVGIGTDTPTSKLTVAGMIQSISGGVQFPDGTVQTTAFLPNQVVRSLNGLTGDVSLVSGANIMIAQAGNTLTVAAPNALTKVAHDNTLTGDGTVASPLSVVPAAATLAPVLLTKDCFLGPIESEKACTITTVPTGKRLVIEHVSSRIDLAVGQLLAYFSIRGGTSPTDASQYFVPVNLGNNGFSVFVAISQQTKLYFDSGTDVQVVFQRGTTNSGTVRTFTTISGFLVDLP